MTNRNNIFFQWLLLPLCTAWLLAGCASIRPVGPEVRPGASVSRFSHSSFDDVLTSHVDARGRVDYQALHKSPRALDAYYRLLATYSPDSHPERFPGEDHRLAYWINAYNSAAIKTVLTYYPVESVLDIKTPPLLFFLGDKAGFFFLQRLTFGGKTTSLYYLENKVIRKRFKDPRIHFALNCASISCPRLPRHAFTGEALERQLDMETRRFIAEPRNFTIDHQNRAIRLSAIFKWYKKDFINWYSHQYPGPQGNLLSYIDLYLPPEQSDELDRVADTYTIQFRSYNWKLNGQHSKN